MKKDTSKTINLDELFSKDSEVKTETPLITESVVEATTVTESIVDYDAILLEWSYRCDKGYPDFNNPSDMIQLQNILKEMNIENPFPIVAESAPVIAEADLNTFKVDKKLIALVKKLGKEKQFAMFIKNLPGGETEPAVERFLANLSPAEQKEFVTKLYSEKTVEGIDKSEYSSGVGSKLYNLEPKGIGKAELFLAWMVANSKVSGGGESYDLLVNGKKMYEVKDYRKNFSAGIRLGTKGKVTRFPFWYEIIKTLDFVESLGKVDPSFKMLGTAAKPASELFKISKNIRPGELSKESYKILMEFYYTMNDQTDTSNKGFTSVTLRGPNVKPVAVDINEIPPKVGKELNLKVTSSPKSVELQNKLIVFSRRLKYVRNPEALESDIQAEIDKSTSAFPFVVFRPNGPIVTSEFRYSNISMGTLYIIEAQIADAKAELDAKKIADAAKAKATANTKTATKKK